VSVIHKFDTHPTAIVGWISLAAFARDFLATKAKNPARVGRDWCKAHGVPYRQMGKTNWAKLEDIKRAFTEPANKQAEERVPNLAAAWR